MLTASTIRRNLSLESFCANAKKLVLECFYRFSHWRQIVNRPNNLLANVLVILGVSILGATLMLVFDDGGTRWLKFILYMVMFASIFSPFLFSSRFSCSFLMGRSRK